MCVAGKISNQYLSNLYFILFYFILLKDQSNLVIFFYIIKS